VNEGFNPNLLVPSPAHRPPTTDHRPRPNVQRPTPNAQRPTPNAQRPTPNAQRPTPNAHHPLAFSYLCQFNALNVLASLHEPSRDKVKAVIYKTIAASTVIYVMFGIAGFIWATSKYDTVAGDILTQFASDDHVIMVGKVGLLVSLLLNVPLLVLPLRDLVIELGCCNLDGLEDGAEVRASRYPHPPITITIPIYLVPIDDRNHTRILGTHRHIG
jgi:hypothetical protein